MKLIAHRGNISGPSEYENHPNYIEEALELGYDCEVDVWYKEGEYWLGHDEPVYDVGKSFLRNDKLWCHAKNLEALHRMLQDHVHCFWHQEDDATLTSRGYIWTYPNKELMRGSICVLPELGINGNIDECRGICSDYLEKYTMSKYEKL
tara:strand:- start:60 stop:506 length:447 start_codon:yes stop_codon:yes gene_type:complete